MRGVLKKTAAILLAVISCFAVFVISAGIYMKMQDSPDSGEMGGQRLSAETERPKSLSADETKTRSSREDMLEKALKSVVGISSAANSPSESISRGNASEWYMGSGVIATEDGYIITNQHVIGARPQRILVTLYNGETIEGKTVWSDSSLDLAVVKVKGENYHISELGDAKKLRVGENVTAIGNPLSMQFQRTVTAGIVSAVGRSISIESGGTAAYMEDLIQTDASINPGNSGGPLLNADGEVVGVNTIKVSTAEGMGFAVPINVCKPIIERLKNVGEFRTPYLGLYAYTAEAARYLNLDAGFSSGLFAAKIDDKGPAFAAGIRYGDVITAVNRISVNTMLELREELYKRQGGETAEIEFERNGSTRRVTVMLTVKQ